MLLRLLPLVLSLAIVLPPMAAAEGQMSATLATSGAVNSGVFAKPIIRPRARSEALPRAAWGQKPGTAIWTRAALSALQGHAAPLAQTVPRDIADWCPAYPQADAAQRRAFWVGFASALARHESGLRAGAVGGGGLYHGLLQILPATAKGHGCDARSAAALQNGAANLSCGLRIMARTVARDGVIATQSGRWRGVAADWGPIRDAAKRKQMQSWLGQQSYCRPLSSIRPKARPAAFRVAQSSEKG